MTIVLAAMRRFQGVFPALDWYSCNPSASVKCSRSVRKISGARKSFQM